MKKLLSLFAFVLIGAYAFGQCTPDASVNITNYPDGTFQPTDSIGIPCALQGQPYDTQLDFVIPTSTVVGTTAANLDSIRVNSVTFVQLEFGYTCGEANCTWDSAIPGCASVSSNNPQTLGEFAIDIDVTIFASLGPITIPVDSVISDFMLRVFATQAEIDSNADCQRAATGIYERELPGVGHLYNSPNPFQGETSIKFNAVNSATFTFQVHNLVGELLHEEELQVNRGQNTINFDGSKLGSGVYFYNITDGKKSLTTRMMKM